MDIAGKWEFEVAPGKERLARAWVAGMLRQYEREIGPILSFQGSPNENGFPHDDSVCGMLIPEIRQIIVFYSEDRDLAPIAEELAHYFQYQQQGLLGQTVDQIGDKVIDRNESAMKPLMLKHGFRIRR